MNPAKPKLRAIKCTQCGGAIELNGGRKILSIVCQYCGTCLDAKKEFAPLYQFANQKKPYMPIKIGKTGKLKGVQFVAIGVIQYEQYDDGEMYRWLEYLMFSGTHGYAWLCFEDGHWVLMHEVKDIPDDPIEFSLPRKTSFKVRDKTFKSFESGSAQIAFVEGEMTWQARQKEKIIFMDAVCPPYIYSMEKRGSEIEFFWGEYIPHTEIAESFKIEVYEPTGVFSCQPFGAPPILKSISYGAIIAAVITIFAYFAISTDGKNIFSHRFSKNVFKDGEESKVFKINNPDVLCGVTVNARMNNAWAAYDLTVLDKNGENTYFSLPAEVSYYEGVEDGERWSEDYTTTTAYFKLPEKGEYKISMEGEGGYNESTSPGFSVSTDVSIAEKVRLGHYTLAWFALCLVIALPYQIWSWSFENKRWNDGEEDDD